MIPKIIDGILDTIKITDSNLAELNFHKIEGVDLTVAFVDGGNAELLVSPDFSLHFMRVCGIVCRGKDKVATEKQECYCLIKVKDGNYVADLFDGRKFIFDMDDVDLRKGNERVDISSIGGCVRRLLEIELASKMQAEIIVLDGSLQAKFALESNYLEKLEGKKLVGLSKTSTELFSGKNVIGVLQQTSKDLDFPWYCNLDGINYVKLNKYSRYIFKVEFTDNVLGCLISCSNDYVFPGYPYGLLLADKFARISNKEKEYFFTKLKTMFGSKWLKVEQSLSALNAHDILDNVC